MNKRQALCYWDNPVTKERFFDMLEIDDVSDIYKTIEIDSLWFLVQAHVVAREINERISKI